MAPDTKLWLSGVKELREQEKTITCHHPTTLLFGKRKAKGDKTIQKQALQKDTLAKITCLPITMQKC